MRPFALPLAAAAAAVVLVAVHLALGGAAFGPAPPRDPCDAPPPRVERRLERVAEAVVLAGLDATACDLGVTRERLVLGLGTPEARVRLAAATGTDATGLEAALREGLDAGVARAETAGALPPFSALLPQAADRLGLPAPARIVLERLPPGLVDGLVETGPALHRAVADLDVRAVLAAAGDPAALERELTAALGAAVLAEARANLVQAVRERVPLGGDLLDRLLPGNP